MKIYNKAEKIALKISAGVTSMGFRIWTRGDGSRYKEPNKIHCDNTSRKFEKLGELYPNNKRLRVRGEFGSDPYDKAIIIDGVVYINRKWYIQFGSTNILRNTSVWRTK